MPRSGLDWGVSSNIPTLSPVGISITKQSLNRHANFDVVRNYQHTHYKNCLGLHTSVVKILAHARKTAAVYSSEQILCRYFCTEGTVYSIPAP